MVLIGTISKKRINFEILKNILKMTYDIYDKFNQFNFGLLVDFGFVSILFLQL